MNIYVFQWIYIEFINNQRNANENYNKIPFHHNKHIIKD